MAKVLQDYTKQGKSRKWGVRKSQSRQYATRLYAIANRDLNPTMKKKAGRVWACGDILEFGKSLDDGGKVLLQAYFCHDRFCALCQWRRMLKMSYQTTKTIEQALIERPTSRFVFLTLTVKNCEGQDIKTTVNALNRAISNKFMKYKRITKNMLGWVKSVEVTVNRDEDTYHPHIHILLMMSSTYFKQGEYISHKEWQALWSKAMKLDYEPMVSVEAVKARNGKDSINASVSELAKYQTKATQYLSLDVDEDVRIIETLREQLAGNRMLSYGGMLKDVHNRLFKREDEQTENLVNVAGDEHVDPKAGAIIAQWNSKFQNYVIVETGKQLSYGRKED